MEPYKPNHMSFEFDLKSWALGVGISHSCWGWQFYIAIGPFNLNGVTRP